MFMLVSERRYISCADGVEMWVLEEEKTFIFVNKVMESHILGQLRQNEEKYN